MKVRRILLTLIVLMATAQPVVAQRTDGETRAWRRWAFGAVAGAVFAGVASFADEPTIEGSTTSTSCSQSSCLVSVSGALGFGLGFLLGYEMDKRAIRQGQEGPSMDLPWRNIVLDDSPTGVVGSDLGLVTLTRNSVGLIDRSYSFSVLRTGIRGRAAAVVGGGRTLVVASNTEIMGLPLPDADRVDRLRDTGAASLASLDGNAIAVGEPGRIRRLSVSGASAVEEGSTETRGVPVAMALSPSGGALWTVVDSSLVARDSHTLEELGRLALPGRGQGLSVTGRTGIVSLGSAGALLVDLSNASNPQSIASLGGMRVAYGAVALNGRAYVAAGSQGLFVFDVSSPTQPRSLGVSRDFGFAADALVIAGRLHVLDRQRNAVAVLEGN